MEKDNEKLKRMIQEEIKYQLNNGLFTSRKITDIPLDDFQVVNRKYVNLYGTTAQRPASPSIGQQYFDTTLGLPIYWNSDPRWVNGQGNPV